MSELPKLNRIPFFDVRSRNFGIRELIDEPVDYRKRTWKLPGNFPLDQGAEGACVGFGWAGELAATPAVWPNKNTSAFTLYHKAQEEDRAMGNNWSEGASVLAGAKASQKLGMLRRYHWAFGIEDVILALVRKGPVVLGINWYSSMYETDPEGRVSVQGHIVGGHCILANGFWPRCPLFDGQHAVVWVNSWGTSYGRNGWGFITTKDLNRLLSEQGEACIATDVRKVA